MNFLITGAAGFIGSHVAEKLVSLGHEVIGVDNFDPFYPRNFKESNLERLKRSTLFNFHEADIRDAVAMKKLFQTGKIDIVIHLAAKAGVRPSIEKIEEYYDVNINGTVNLLKCMHEANLSKMIFASSSSVYGNNTKVPFSEADPVDNPISPYAATKKSGELLCHVYSHLYKFDITCLRFFTVFGPGQRPDLAIHQFVRLIDQDNTINVFGDGTTSRDYTYIDDIVSGVICAIDNLKGYHVYNLGESRVIMLKDLIALIEKTMGKKANLAHKPLQPGDVQTTYADISRARSELGYAPQYDMETGLKQFYSWYNKNKIELYAVKN